MDRNFKPRAQISDSSDRGKRILADFKNRIPLRVKIATLIGIALTLSLGVYLWMSLSLFTSDKESYILDYNLTRVQSSAAAIHHQIDKALLQHRLAEALHLSGGTPALSAFAEDSFGSEDFRAMLVMEANEAGQYRIRHSFPFETPETNRLSGELGWTRETFARTPTLITIRNTGELIIASRAGNSGSRAYVSLVQPAFGDVEAARGYQIALISRLAEVIDASGDDPSANAHARWLSSEALVRLARPMLEGNFDSGAQNWEFEGESYMAGYVRLRGGELSVVGVIPRSVAFAATRALRNRGLLLGASLMAIALGLALLFGRRITSGLRQMAHATSRVTSGVFNFRVDVRGMGNDEIGSLASSFNRMAQKIDDLMDDTASKAAAKAAIEKELETVTAIRENFLPAEAYGNLRFSLAGSAATGSRFSGEWWQYASHLDHVIVVAANTSADGALGAMLTASAHAAFSNFMATTRLISDRPPNLKLLMHYLNTAIHGAARGEETMSCFAALIDTYRGVMEVVNCGHPPAWLYRIDSKETRSDKDARFRPLECPVLDPLGTAATIRVKLTEVELRAGDGLILRTRSLAELTDRAGIPVEQSSLREELAGHIESSHADPEKICKRFLEKSAPSLTGRGKNRDAESDLTLIVGTVPKDADLHPEYGRVA